MNEKIKIGFVCAKGSNHIQWIGDSDYGSCRSSEVAEIFLMVQDLEDLYPDFQNLLSVQEVATQLKFIIKEHESFKDDRDWREIDS